MPLTQLIPPYPIFTDKNGDPLDAGYLYFGVADQNPETNPIQIYYDRGFTQPVAQPVRTSNGYVMRNGSPAQIYADSQFSVTVRNKRNELVIYSPVGFGVTPGVPFAVFENAARDVAALLADTQFTYAAGVPNTVQVAPGDILRTLAEGFAYEVAASGATDQHVTTAGGVKLYAEAASDGFDVRAFGAIGDGVADDTATIQAAVDTGKAILIPAGTFRITGTITFPGDMRMTFEDGGKILADTGTYSGFYALRAAGSITQISDLGSNATKGDTSLTFASAPSLAFDDTILIFNPTNSSWSGFRTNYKAGEFCHVEGISGTTVTLQAPLYDGYVVADVDVYKVNHIAVDLQNPTIENVGSALGSIFIEFGRNVQITNPQITDKNNSCIALRRCIGGDIFGGRCVNEGDGGDDYALALGNSSHITIHGGSWYARRHATASGGDAEVGCVPVRGIKFIGCRISNDRASATHAADFHGNAEHCGYYNCLIQGGVSPQGADISIVNCDVYGGMSFGPCVYAAEVLGGRYRISGNRFYTQTNPQPAGRGVIDFGGNSNAINANTTRDLIIEFTGNTITSEALSSITSLVLVRNAGTTKKISVDCSNNHFDVNDFNGALFVRLASGTADSDFLICDNNTSRVKGKYSLSPNADYVNGLTGVTRAQGYRWTDSVTTSTGASAAIGALVTFPWRFPREPAVTTAKIDSTYIGNRVGIVVANPVTEQTARLVLATDDLTDFSLAQTIKVCGEAAIREV